MFSRVKKRKGRSDMKKKWMKNDVVGYLIKKKKRRKEKYEGLKLLWSPSIFIFQK